MNLIDQVCSLPLAMRLKELGIKRRSIFYHITFINTSSAQYDKESEKFLNDIIADYEWDDYKERNYLKKLKRYSAFTVAELGKMLPDCIKGEFGYEAYIKSQKKDDEYKIYLDNIDKITIFFGKNEANARAKMLIHLLENKLIGLQEGNKILLTNQSDDSKNGVYEISEIKTKNPNDKKLPK